MPHPRAALIALGAVVLAVVLLLAWAALGEPWPTFAQPEPRVVEVEVPVAGAWIVLAVERPIRVVGTGVLVEACITYTTPGGQQETCRQTQIGPDLHFGEIAECWDQARIGSPLPDCWR